MRRNLTVLVAAIALFGAPLAVRSAEGEQNDRPREVPHYESPILSLLLLPVNLLIRMTSIVSPDAAKPAKESPRGE